MQERIRRMAPAGVSAKRAEATEALLDAAERLLTLRGHAGITSRALASEARVNHGLVHYYFGSMEELLVQVLERFTDRLVKRQREMYAADVPFLKKWETAWAYQDDDLESGYSKIWLELQALAWNDAGLRERVARVNAEWRAVLTQAFAKALAEYGVADRFPVDAMVPLVMTFAQGVALERLSGITEGHDALLAWIHTWLASLKRPASVERAVRRSPPGRRGTRR
jgi:AcrR family transcriptional regulator